MVIAKHGSAKGDSEAMRQCIRRYGALCGYVELTADEWQVVKDDLKKGRLRLSHMPVTPERTEEAVADGE